MNVRKSLFTLFYCNRNHFHFFALPIFSPIFFSLSLCYILISVPFDTKQPLGFYAVLTLQCLSGMSYMLLVSLFSGFYIGMCTYIDTCVKDLSTFVEEVNEISNYKKSIENQRKFHELTSGMIKFHTDILM